MTGVTGDLVYTFGYLGNLVAPWFRGGAGLRVETYEPGSLAGRSSTLSEVGFGGGAGLDFDLVSWSISVGSHLLTGGSAGVWSVTGGISVPLGGRR